MIKLLAKNFIKDYQNVKDGEIREKYGVLCGGVGIILNVFLFAGKLLAGTISGNIAITADAFNNLSDAGSSFITMVGFKLGSQKPDPEHPFGHGRIEYLSGLAVSILILIMSFELFHSSLDKIKTPVAPEFSPLIAVILVISILVKLYMAYYNNKVGDEIDSAAMRATAKDSLSDTVSTSLVLIAAIIGFYLGVAIDGYCGILVALFICYSGIEALKDTIGPLLGQPPTEEFVEQIEAIVLNSPMVSGMHDLVVHDYGPGRVMISLHAEVPHDEDILKIHDEIDVLEFVLKQKLNCDAVIHMDPVMINDERVTELKNMVGEIIEKIDPELKFHDFRVVFGETHTNLIFDVVAPFKYKLSDEMLVMNIFEAVQVKNPKLMSVIKVDHAYTK